MSKHTLSTVATSLRDLADVLDLMEPATAPSQRVTAPKATTTTKGAQKAPEGVSCVGCGKAMVANPVCRACTKKGVTADGTLPAAQKAPEAAPKAKVAAKVAPEARATGRRDPKAHCEAVGCGLFVKAGEAFCAKHALEATRVIKVEKAPEGTYISLDDGKRGYRVPADMVLALRAVDLDDATIIAAAKAKGLGHKVPKAAGVLAK